MKLLMLKGLPASGKSTYAEELVKGGGWVHVNKDLLRTMLHFDKFSHNREDMTVRAEIAIAIEALKSNINVVVDDTNLGERHRNLWSGVAKDCGATFETREIDTDVSTCLERDALRDKKVGAHVIINMAMQYRLIPELKDIIVCDIDGTIADGTHRQHHLHGEKKDWKSYFSELSGDTLRKEVVDSVLKLSIEANAWPILVSARPETYRKETEEWLLDNNIPYHNLIMRGAHDKREDSMVKEEIYNKYLKHYNIIKVFDDRPRVIRMWRKHGIDVEDVGNGIEF